MFRGGQMLPQVRWQIPTWRQKKPSKSLRRNKRVSKKRSHKKKQSSQRKFKRRIDGWTSQKIERAKLDPEEREQLEKVDKAQADLAQAQESFDTYSGMTEVQAGQDSMVVLDGVAQLSSNNNVIEDAVEGIDITVKGKHPKTSRRQKLAEYDRNSVRQDIEAFVNSYNQFYQVSKNLAGVDPTTGQRATVWRQYRA